jgi:hypothetical protein
MLPLPSILPHYLSVHHPLVPCHQRRQGELIETWSPKLRVLCTFTITPHPHLLASTPTCHLVHASDADMARWILSAFGNWAASILLIGINFTFSNHNHIRLSYTIPAKARAREANQARAINDAFNALRLGQQWGQWHQLEARPRITVAMYVSAADGTPGRPGDPTLDGWRVWNVRRHLSCGMLYAFGVVSFVRE